MENYSLSDVAAATKDSGFGGGSAWVLIILFALIFGWGGNGFGGNSNAATTADVQRAVDNNAIQSDIQRTAYENMAVTKDANYNSLSETRDLQAAVATGFANQQTCCCEVKSEILENRYLAAQNTAAINANTTAATQRILDQMASNRISELENTVQDLRMQAYMCGIPRVSPYGYNMIPSTTSCGYSSTNI